MAAERNNGKTTRNVRFEFRTAGICTNICRPSQCFRVPLSFRTGTIIVETFRSRSISFLARYRAPTALVEIISTEAERGRAARVIIITRFVFFSVCPDKSGPATFLRRNRTHRVRRARLSKTSLPDKRQSAPGYFRSTFRRAARYPGVPTGETNAFEKEFTNERPYFNNNV